MDPVGHSRNVQWSLFSENKEADANSSDTSPPSPISSVAEEASAFPSEPYFIPPRRQDSFGNLSSVSHYPGSSGNPFTPIYCKLACSDDTEVKSNLSPYLQNIKKNLTPFKHDLLKYSLLIFKECQDPSNQAEAILHDLAALIHDLTRFSFNSSFFYKHEPYYFIYEDALDSLASVIANKSDFVTIAIFENWIIYQLCTATTSIKYALWIKEHYSPSFLKNSLHCLLNFFKTASTNGPMKQSLEDAQKQIIKYALTYLEYVDENDKTESTFIHISVSVAPTIQEKIDILLPYIQEIFDKTLSSNFLFRLPVATPSNPPWIIQESHTSDDFHRQNTLTAFCNEKKHPIDRLKNLLIYLSYPTTLSHKDWLVMEAQYYSWNGNILSFVEVIDREIAAKLFESDLHFTEIMQQACQSIRKKLHPDTSLIEYLFSGMLSFSTERIRTYLYLIPPAILGDNTAQIFHCLRDGVKILRTMQKLGKDFSRIPNTPPHLFKELNSFFYAMCTYLEMHILEKSQVYMNTYVDWPTKKFNADSLTPSQMAIRMIGFFNQLVLDKLSSSAIQSEETGDQAFALIQYLAPEVRLLFLKEAMANFMRNTKEEYPLIFVEELLTSGFFEEYTDPALFWSDVQKNPLSHHLFTKNQNKAAIAKTKIALQEKVLAAFISR